MPRPEEFRSFALTGLFVLAAFYTLYFTRAFFVPVVLALLLSFLFAPVVRGLKRLRLPVPLGAALVLFVVTGAITLGIYFLWEPALDWTSRAPAAISQLERRLQQFKRPVQQVTSATERVEQLTSVDSSSQKPPEVKLKEPTLADVIFGGARAFLVQAVLTLVLLYLILASGGAFVSKLVRLLPQWRDETTAVQVLEHLEANISGYLGTVAVINACLGVVVGLAMYLVGMPTPALWGVLAGLLNFVPYLGAIFCLLVISVVASLTFASLAKVIFVAALYLTLTSIEGVFVTPMLLGRRLSLNPVVVFVGLIFWGWCWGIAGALIAVPLLVVVKIVFDHVDYLRPVADLLGP